MFSKKDSVPPIPLTPLKRRNPLVELSTDLEELLDSDVVLSTHSHFDHFDQEAADHLDKSIHIIHQEEDEKFMRKHGFESLFPIKDKITYEGIKITRIEAQHGHGITAKLMGPASGYVLQSDNEPTVYIAGDTVYNSTVKSTIESYQPEYIILNGGSPKFLMSDPIVMTIMDIEKTISVKPDSHFIVVHLDTMNHCIETREDLLEYFTPEKKSELKVTHLHLPMDNETLL